MEDILHIPELRDSIFLNLNLYDLYNIRSCNKSLNQYVSCSRIKTLCASSNIHIQY